ncbi:MAG TPA: ABC transporter substrate-binding protein [Stellaceae bacterium]|nr:ABC transporter substrate-binding protein [Stellaceae bacterium]
MRRMQILVVAVLALAGPTAQAEPIKLGVTKIANCAPIAIALAKGYFAAEGLEPQLTIFESQAPIAVAVASGDIDAGLAAQTAALYNLGAAGRVRIIASGVAEAPSFHDLALVASLKAYAAGLKTPHDLPGHSFALTQMGTGLQYNLGRIAAKEGFALSTVTLLPLQSNPNIISALAGGRADAAVIDATNALPLVDKGEVKLIAWAGDLTGYTPAYLLFASRDFADHHADATKRLLSAYRKGVNDYYDAFTDAAGLRKDGPTAPAMLDIIAKFVGQSTDRVDLSLAYYDREARIDVLQIQEQIDWYRSIGAIKGEVKAPEVLDMRYVVERH